MRTSALIGSILAMAGAWMPTNSFVLTDDIYPVKTLDTNRPKRCKTGVTYPHSSKRQRARYARQIAAGQLSMAGIDAA